MKTRTSNLPPVHYFDSINQRSVDTCAAVNYNSFTVQPAGRYSWNKLSCGKICLPALTEWMETTKWKAVSHHYHLLHTSGMRSQLHFLGEAALWACAPEGGLSVYQVPVIKKWAVCAWGGGGRCFHPNHSIPLRYLQTFFSSTKGEMSKILT